MSTYVNLQEREAIILSIVQKRNEMFKQAQENGLGAQQTVACSQELDNLMNQLTQFDQLNN